MATALTSIVTNARVHLIEASASFWSDAELLQHAQFACQDLWKAIIDLYQDYFLTIDETNVSQAASTSTLTGVPADLFRVKAIEPRTLDLNTNVIYRPLDLTHPDFMRARAETTVGGAGQIIYYDIVSTGAPAGTPTIYVAPQLSAALLLRLIYIPTLSTSLTNNPIPGHSDNAVMAWVIAYARAKEREDRAPDSEWLAIYGTDKQNLLTSLTPRQEDEPDYAEGLFEDSWE